MKAILLLTGGSKRAVVLRLELEARMVECGDRAESHLARPER